MKTHRDDGWLCRNVKVQPYPCLLNVVIDYNRCLYHSILSAVYKNVRNP